MQHNGINKRYTIEITTLTPINIGAGAEKDWVKGVDFVIDKNKLYKLNLKKMIAAGVDVNKLASFFESHNESGIKGLLNGKLEKVSDAVYDCPINDVSNDVKSFIKNQLTGKPIIPGSSLKGAIRSVIFHYMGGHTKDGNEVFGEVKNGENLMRFIKISDAEFEETKLLNSKIFNLYKDGYIWKGGWKHAGGRNSLTDSKFKQTGFNTIFETIDKGKKGYCDIMFSTDLYEQVVAQKLNSVIYKQEANKALDIYQLFSIINKHTAEHIKKDLAFYEKYSNNKTPQISDCLIGLLKSMTDDNSCVIKMSAGSGFHSITGDWQFDDYSIDDYVKGRGMKDGNKSAKSRKIIIDGDNLMPMGFVKLRILSDEEVKQRQEKQEKLIKEQAETIRLEREKQEAAAQAERQRRIEEQEKRDKFEQLIIDAQTHLNSDNVEQSQKLITEAEALFPDDPRLVELKQQLQELEKKIELEKLNQELEQADAKKYQCSLAEKLSKINNIKTAIGNIKPWLKNNQKDVLNEQDKVELKDALTRIFQDMKPRDQKDLCKYNRWKDLEAYVDANTVLQWFHEISGQQ